MKGIIILILLITFGSCTNKSEKVEVIKLDNTSGSDARCYKIYVHDGCEYIVVGDGNSLWGSHKGDCKNPIHNK